MKKGLVSKKKGASKSLNLVPGRKKQQILKVGGKKRNSEPGIRHQGGRIYDSENGTTCHQCRQKTVEVKAPCREAKCNLNFCPRCLLNRYNEVVDTVRKLDTWKCPKCRNICNCSFCRRKQGLRATGILSTIAKKAGFGSVSHLLEKNPNMTTQLDESARQKNAQSKENGVAKSRGASLQIRSVPDFSGVKDSKLSKKRRLLPEPVAFKIHTGKQGGRAVDIPDDIQEDKLLCILEFFATFGEEALGMKEKTQFKLAQELVGMSTRPSGSVAAPVLQRAMAQLKAIICDWFGEDDGAPSSWEEWSVKKFAPSLDETSSRMGRRGTRTASRGTTFWSLGTSQRLDIVYEMVHESLACAPIVHIIEERVEDTDLLAERGRKLVNKIKCKMKQEQEEYLQKYIAHLISSNNMSNLSSEKQKDIVSIARENAVNAVSEETKARMRWATGQYSQSDPRARLLPVGEDRHGALYFSCKCASLVGGKESAIVRINEGKTECLCDIRAIRECLELEGHKEGALKIGLSELEKRLQ